MATMTTISVSKKTRDQLARFGSKDESFEDILKRLIGDAGWRQQEELLNRILAQDEFIPLENL